MLKVVKEIGYDLSVYDTYLNSAHKGFSLQDVIRISWPSNFEEYDLFNLVIDTIFFNTSGPFTDESDLMMEKRFSNGWEKIFR